MAKLRNKESNGSLIFTWVIIILLALATAAVVLSHLNTEREYRENHSTFIMNEEIANALADALDTPAGLITQEDLGKIEGAFVMLDMPISFGGNSQTTLSSVEFHLDGFKEANDAYYAEGVTDEDRKELVDPSTLAGYAYLSDANDLDDLKLLTSLKSFSAFNYGETVNTSYDFVSFAAENFKELDELIVSGFNTKDITPVKNLTKLETLAVDGTELTDISVLSSVTTLKDLTISGTSVVDISAISALMNLEALNLSNNLITDISALSSLNNEKITSLTLTGNAIVDYTPVEHIDAEKITRDKTEAEKAAEDAAKDSADDSANKAEDTTENTEA